MSAEANKFYVTTPIYYVNARPHIGHAYTTIVADVLARRHRLLGEDVFFLTGTDEHGQKIERSAAKAGIAPQQFADQVSASFKTLWDRMGITYSDYIRTTEPRHADGVQTLFRELYRKGFIYLDSYTGAYCVSDEAFVDVPVGAPCPDCGRPTEQVTEENFFFKLSAFQQPLLDLIESGQLKIENEARRNEVLSFVRGGLRDLSVSRSSFSWGIPVPEDVQRAAGASQPHVVYVWLDALTNYMSAVGYGNDSAEARASFAKWWPADLHLVGKEIIRFHCVYWPAFLLALNPAFGSPLLSSRSEAEGSALVPPQLSREQHAAWATKMLPKAITAHGWLLFDNDKMSKSKGNIVRIETILEAFGEHVYAKQFPDSTKAERDLFASDVLRYFLLREIPFGQDGSFSFESLVTRYNADLANGYGNLVSRTLKMIEQYCGETIPSLPSGVGEFKAGPAYLLNAITSLKDDHSFISTIAFVQAAVAGADGFITNQVPWKLHKEGANERVNLVLRTAAESIRIITALLHPILPFATARVWAQLGLGDIEAAARNGELNNLEWGGLQPGTKLGPLAPIFPRADKNLAQIMTDMENEKNSQLATSQLATGPQDAPATTSPAAAPRALDGPTGELPVAGSLSTSSGADATPPHTEAQASGVFAGTASQTPVTAAPADASPQITIDDFAKVELRIAEVLVCERIPKADKLLRLEVSLGGEQRRQILSGIAEWYAPEDLVGRRIIVITNLAPRKMRGLESHGMLLAASEEGGKPFLATVPEGVPVGTRLK